MKATLQAIAATALMFGFMALFIWSLLASLTR